MVNNLSTVEKNLRSIAKRYENIKYSVGLAVLFLMKGTSAFSDDNMLQEAEKQKEVLNDNQSTKEVVKKVKAKKQVTQKLKASWATMQFGANDLYSNFFVTSKTKIDKASIVKSENTILLASADNSGSLPIFSKISSDMEETYAPTTEDINTSKGNLRNSIGNLQEKINNARAENAKEVQGLKLELVQLMEQGDQVVKSPWSSWQFGTNFMYSKWNGTYKGRGDKLTEGTIINRSANSLDPLAKNIAIPNLKNTNYGSTDLNIVKEPNASISITKSTNYGSTDLNIVEKPKTSVSLTTGIEDLNIEKEPKTSVSLITGIAPVIIDKGTARKAQENHSFFKFPFFEETTVRVPIIPIIDDLYRNIDAPSADFIGRQFNGINNKYSYWHTDNSIGGADGNLYQTSVEKGEVLKRRGGTVNRIQLQNYQRGQIQVKPVNVDSAVEPPRDANISGDVPTFFMSLVDIPYSYFGKDSKLSLINENNNVDEQVFIHFESKGNPNDKFDKLKTDGHISTEEFNEIRKYTDDIDFKNNQGGELYHVNRGTVELGGTGVRYIQTNFAGNSGNRVNLIENRGNIVSMNYEDGNTKTSSNTIFAYAGDTATSYTGTQNIYVNNKTGKISMYGEKGYFGVFSADNCGNPTLRGPRDISFINDGEVNLYGRNSIGLFIAPYDSDEFSTKSNFIMNKPINLQGDNSVGLYISYGGEGLKNARNTARFVIGTKDNATIPAYVPENSLLNVANSKKANHNKVGGDENLAEEIIGIYLKGYYPKLHVKVPQLEIEKFAKKSIGIFVDSGGEVKATDGNIAIKGGENNIALYSDRGEINYTGNININKSTLAGDKGNTNGIGNMGIYSTFSSIKVNGDVNIDTRDSVAIYSHYSDINLNGKTNIKLKAETTGKNIGVYANGNVTPSPHVVRVQTNQSKIEIDGKKDDGTITNQGVALYAKDGGIIFANGTSLSDGLYMKVKNGGSAIVSDGATSNVEARYSTIDYDGDSYALYSVNDGNIDVRNSKISLYGNSTGFERSGDLTDPFPIKLTDAKFYVNSKDAVIMNLKNIPSLNFSTLANTLFQGTLNGAEVHVASGIKNYKLATIDGLTSFDIDSDYDKSRALNLANEKTNDYVLTRNLIMKRATINLKSGNNVRAILSSNDIAELGERTAVGLTNFVGNGINLETNTNVNVDRTDKGNASVGTGSVGLYVDGGVVNVASGATINVEKENNFANGSSVGIYAVRDAVINNGGTVNVGGKGSVGIFGMAHRIDPDGNPIQATGGSQTHVENLSTGVINMDGESAIGMYVLNNASFGSNPVNQGHNYGVINMSGNNAMGILTTGGQVYNMNTININSEQGGIGIYATAGTDDTPHSSDTGNSSGGVINLRSSVSKDNPNIGIFTEILKDGYGSNLSNSGDIIGGDNNYGIYGAYIWHDTGKIKLGDNSVGIFGLANIVDSPSEVNVTDGEIEVGNNSKGIFVSGNSAVNVINGAKMTIGDNSFAYVLKTKEIPEDPIAGNPAIQSVLESNSTDETKLGNNSTFIYSSDKTATITNSTPLRTTGNKNYGIYASGNITNLADMDFSSGVGNVGILNVRDIGSTTSKAVNGQLGAATQPTITVGRSDIANKNYSIGMAAGYLDKDGVLKQTGHVENYGKIDVVGEGGIGMYAAGSGSTAINHIGAEINLRSSVSKDNPNIGMFTETLEDGYGSNLFNSGDIIGGDNNYGIYGAYIWHDTGKIKLGNNSVGIFGLANILDSPSEVNVTDGEIEVGNNSKGIFVSGNSATKVINGAKMTIGDNSFAYVLKTKEIPEDPIAGNPAIQSVLESNSTDETKLGNNSTFIYSSDKTATITNSTPLRTTGNKNYGIYASGNITNLADMDFSSGVGNVGILNVRDIGSTTSKAVNGQLGAATQPTITVGRSDTDNKNYSIGMAAGYLDKDGVLKQTGHVENYGKIDVVEEGGIGMYAAGKTSVAINHQDAEINLSAKDSIGMYLTDYAIGENYGTIRTAPNNTKDGIIGVVANNGAIIKNYGTIEIRGKENTGILLTNGGTREGNDPVNLDGAEGVKDTGVLLPDVGTGEPTKPADLDGSESIVTGEFQPTGKIIKDLEIETLKNNPTTIRRNGNPVVPTFIDTIVSRPNEVIAGSTTLDLRNTTLAEAPSLTRASSLGMYVDTSGRQFTNPIQGLEHLTNLKEVNLIYGIEATNYTTSKDIQVGENILEPFNEAITKISKNKKTKFNLNSGSLTWIATGTQNPNDNTFDAVYLSKIPYTAYAKDKNTYNFMDGLEQRYGVEALGSREKSLFDKLNEIGKGEPRLFAQAVDQMKGHQYANTQQRVQATGDILNKEFNYLRNEWSNLTKDSNKIKTFGAQGEYKTNTAGVEDYKSNAYGVAYVHEDETVRLGESTGWYAGMVHNKLSFKDFGNSKEEMLQGKLGLFKSVPFDENNSLNWTISGDISVGYNKMHRKYLVVDEIFNAKSRYNTYGVGLKNEISKEFRLTEGFSVKPYAALNVEYGRVSKIKEKSGEMKLEVKGNDYLSVRPKIGSELAYKHYFGAGAFKAAVGVAYENELGRVANAHNKARVANTSADWYDLRGEKEDRRGNVKLDLNVGLESERYGVTANVGYDTKGENLRGGVGLRVKF